MEARTARHTGGARQYISAPGTQWAHLQSMDDRLTKAQAECDEYNDRWAKAKKAKATAFDRWHEADGETRVAAARAEYEECTKRVVTARAKYDEKAAVVVEACPGSRRFGHVRQGIGGGRRSANGS